MSCQAAKERLVDPELADRDGMLDDDHLETCAECGGAARAYAKVDRLYGPDRTGRVPADFDSRVLTRLGEKPRRAVIPRVPRAALAGGAMAIVILLGILVWPRSGPEVIEPGSRSSRDRRGAQPAAAEEAVPDIAAVNPELLDVNAPQLSNRERAAVGDMYDPDFLLFADALAGIEAFYPEDVMVGPVVPAATPEPPAVRPAETRDQKELRLLAWRRMPQADRARVERLDQSHRQVPASKRLAIERRWENVSWFPVDDKVGIRRLIFRLADLPPAEAAAVVGQIKAVAVEPVERRGAAWRALPFAQRLTGQEQTAGERLLIAR